MKSKVFIIGSVKHMDAIYHIAEKWKKKGFEVEHVFPQPDKPLVNLIHETFEKIKKADIVVAVKKEFWVNNEPYGEGTLYEMEFAEKIEKTVIQETPYIFCKNCTRYGDLHSSCMRVRDGEAKEDDEACNNVVLSKKHYQSQWICYEDGSGHMEYKGNRFFSYDLHTYPYGVEYQFQQGEEWKNFDGSFEEFKDMAEKYIKKRNNI